jgi:hypothetical protein
VRHCYIELLPGTNHSSSRTRQMGSYEILTSSLSLAAMVRRCNTTALYCTASLRLPACLCAECVRHDPACCICCTNTARYGESGDTTWESVRPHAARKLPAMQADCCLALEALEGCTSVSLGFCHSHRLLLRCGCSMRRAPMRLEIGILSQVRAAVLCTCTYMYLCTPLTVQVILC